jgi:hypothetical protein
MPHHDPLTMQTYKNEYDESEQNDSRSSKRRMRNNRSLRRLHGGKPIRALVVTQMERAADDLHSRPSQLERQARRPWKPWLATSSV